jgi:hypothetical protein
VVWDAHSLQRLRAFDGVRDFYERLLALAFTPDGKYLVATTGYPTPGFVPHGPKNDLLLVYDLSDLRAPVQTGPKAGQLSWDEQPVCVRLASGRTVDFTASPVRQSSLMTFAVEDIGPGLRIDGVLADEEAKYFVSGVVGPAAFVPTTGRLYRFSVDPAHPLRTPATLDPPPAGKPVPPEGAVEFPRGQTVFYAGQGALRFENGKLRADYRVDYPSRNPKADLDAEAARTKSMRQRAWMDRERVGLTFDQVRQLRAATTASRGGPPGPDAAQLEPLFAKWQAAAPGPARGEAAKPLFAAARAAGEWDAQAKRAVIAGVREIVTPRQWKLLNYEIPADSDK